MKINEIIVSEILGGSGTGSSPSSKAARDSESRRANLEYKELKKFSTEFANEFLNQFNLIGRTSVDVAYQKASITFAKRNAESKEEREEIINDLKKFRSAMPAQYKDTKRTYDPNQKKTRGGQLGNQNAYKGGGSSSNVVPKGPVGKVTKAIGDAGKDYKKDFKTGQAAGNWLAGKLSNPIGKSKVAASKQNPGKKL